MKDAVFVSGRPHNNARRKLNVRIIGENMEEKILRLTETVKGAG
jgi:hypothetical protein